MFWLRNKKIKFLLRTLKLKSCYLISNHNILQYFYCTYHFKLILILIQDSASDKQETQTRGAKHTRRHQHHPIRDLGQDTDDFIVYLLNKVIHVFHTMCKIISCQLYA